MTDPTCKACQGSWPKEDHFIADLGLSKAYLHEDQFFPGWTVVVFKRHATELFHLAPTERIHADGGSEPGRQSRRAGL